MPSGGVTSAWRRCVASVGRETRNTQHLETTLKRISLDFFSVSFLSLSLSFQPVVAATAVALASGPAMAPLSTPHNFISINSDPL